MSSRMQWTDAVLGKVRRWARDGYTIRETAKLLGVKHSVLQVQVTNRKIRFHGKSGAHKSHEAGDASLYQGGPWL